MADNSGSHIKIDEHFISTVRDQLMTVRNQISVVRGGVNPNDEAHPHGMPLSNLAIVPGHANFANGVDLKSKVTTIAGQVDTKLGAFDLKLDKYSQTLDHILASADNVELTNMSLTDYGRYTGESGVTGPPPVTGV
ncbi:hypothetical protein AB0J86_31045 [Micromonospora sp. NPDC049559]|uniref:hypothetical protein n=1 Tax=Micromonospora sp. NPDC049559 TaxID=3155923 RepID=UPI00342D167D